jgi:hypothetical protein
MFYFFYQNQETEKVIKFNSINWQNEANLEEKSKTKRRKQ